MSENNDILEYIVQCLLNNKSEHKSQTSTTKLKKFNIDRTENCLLKRNLNYIIQQEVLHDNLDMIYRQFELEQNISAIHF
tara:strand:+ start:14138 stop:14377 length:240 start_codon:yes stop_codon:yes gene_type:complete